MVGIISSAMLVSVTMFSPWGIDTLTLPFPFFHQGEGLLYISLFVFGFIVILPISEEGFYRIFQASQWKGILADLMISFFYGIMNYFAMIPLISNWGARLAYAFLSFAFSLVLIYVRDKQNIVLSLMARFGINFGLILWGLFLWKSQEIKVPRLHPRIFLSFNKENIFN